ncbi:MAG: hypothetical protein H6713_12895 [Myxococcales bacterium]|nr:hypothetical protein [Myxococcales bacterium]
MTILDPRELTTRPRPRQAADLASYVRYSSFCRRFAAAVTSDPLLHELLRMKRSRVEREAAAAGHRPVTLDAA